MLCSYCGHWNDLKEERCARCGRRFKQKPPGSWERLGQKFQNPPVLPDPVLKTEPKLLPPDPPWRQELNQKLDTYRTRQQVFEEIGKSSAARAGKFDLSGTGANVIAFARGSSASPPIVPGGGDPITPAPERKPDPRWRRVERPPESPKLPPLRKPGTFEGSEEAFPGRRGRPTPADARTGAGSNPTVAPVSLRAVAGLLDLSLVLVALGVFVGVFRLMGGPVVLDQDGVRALVFAFFTIIIFYWIFYIRYSGETAGMMWLGLRLVNFDGRPPTEGQLRARALGTVLSTAAVGLGFAWLLADEEQLTWHDRMSKTLVTREEPDDTQQ